MNSVRHHSYKVKTTNTDGLKAIDLEKEEECVPNSDRTMTFRLSATVKHPEQDNVYKQKSA